MTGLIVVAGFGPASVYIAPLAGSLLNPYGVGKSMLIFGVVLLISACFTFLTKAPSHALHPWGWLGWHLEERSHRALKYTG